MYSGVRISDTNNSLLSILLPFPPCRCPICMMDFTEGEPIRLLPCMHFYHMRCIDDWLMRSYSCPTCMERVDVGMHHTSTALSAQSGLRRRRRRRERGSSSSITSAVSVASMGGAEGGPKRREEGRRQFVPDYVQQARRQVVFASGQDTPASGQDSQVSGQIVLAQGEHLPGQAEAMATPITPSSVGNMNYLTDLPISRTSSGQSTGRHASIASAGGHGREVQVLNDSGFAPSQDDLAYSMDQMTFRNYRGNRYSPLPQGAGYLPPSSPVRSPNVGVVPSQGPYSPPVFEYHFEYPTSPQHNS